MPPTDWVTWMFIRARYSVASGGSKATTRSPVQSVLQERLDRMSRLPKAAIVGLLKVRTHHLTQLRFRFRGPAEARNEN